MYERAGRTVEAPFAPSTIVRGGALLRTRKVILAAGAAYAGGSLLGVVSLGAVTSAVKASGANTGSGTLTLDAAPLLARAKIGIYTLRCTAVAANGGTFRLEDPDGLLLGDYVLPGAAGGTVAIAKHVKATIADGATDFALGDGFDVTVAAAPKVNGMDRVRLAAAAAVDGSQDPGLVLAYAVDANANEIETIAYESGDFIRERLVVGAGLTLDGVRERLRRMNVTFG